MFRILSQPSYKVPTWCELEIVTSKIFLDRELGLFHAVVGGAFHLWRTQIDRSPCQNDSGAKEKFPSTLLEESESSICRYQALTWLPRFTSFTHSILGNTGVIPKNGRHLLASRAWSAYQVNPPLYYSEQPGKFPEKWGRSLPIAWWKLSCGRFSAAGGLDTVRS